MAYNNPNSRTRSSACYNKPGHSLEEPAPYESQSFVRSSHRLQSSEDHYEQDSADNHSQNVHLQKFSEDKPEDIKMKQEDDGNVPMPLQQQEDGADEDKRPHWMKSRLPGVKKLSNRERRRRQNQTLRRMLTPKNALMVLNEMLPNDNVHNLFKIEPSPRSNFCDAAQHSFFANLSLDGVTYTGYGENKLMARYEVAEQAVRDIVIKKMQLAEERARKRAMEPDFKDHNEPRAEAAPAPAAAAAAPADDADADAEDDDELPMLQLVSFALHKLFSDWESKGFKVPVFRPINLQMEPPAEPAAAPPPAPAVGPKVSKPRSLPEDAARKHPCTLLALMRGAASYRELPRADERSMFTLALDVAGATYLGKAHNKKEARKLAAKAACESLYGVVFEEH